MSRKSIKTKKVETAKTLASSFNTDWFNISYLDNVGVVLNCNSITLNTGTLSIEVRMKADENSYSDPVVLTLSAVPTLADADADFFINLNQVPATELRVVFTVAGATPSGTVDVWINSKTVGG